MPLPWARVLGRRPKFKGDPLMAISMRTYKKGDKVKVKFLPNKTNDRLGIQVGNEDYFCGDTAVVDGDDAAFLIAAGKAEEVRPSPVPPGPPTPAPPGPNAPPAPKK